MNLLRTLTAGPMPTTFIRSMLLADLCEVVRIEQETYTEPWKIADFEWARNNGRSMCAVMQTPTGIAGFVVYFLHPKHLTIDNITVRPKFIGQGYGRQLIEYVIRHAARTDSPRTSVNMVVRETNLHAQQFMRHMEFRCEGILREHYDGTDETGYAFRRKV